jgi:lysozyme family protein
MTDDRTYDLWDEYYQLLLDFEGRGCDKFDKHDPGGLTCWGIDQRSHPKVDLRALTEDTAELIYLKEFSQSWSSVLPETSCYVAFDFIVNAGHRPATKCLQRIVGAEPDGKMGPQTKSLTAAYFRTEDQALFIQDFTLCRNKFYVSLNKDRYIKGWLRRSKEVQDWALAQL